MDHSSFSIPYHEQQSFSLRRDLTPKYHSIWHSHQEIELVYVIEGSGTLCIGDRIQTVQPGTIVWIPSSIPHYWLFDEKSDGHDAYPINCIVAHFVSDFGITHLLHAPEFVWLAALIDQRHGGFQAEVGQHCPFNRHLLRALEESGLNRLFEFLKALREIRNVKGSRLLSPSYTPIHLPHDQHRMNAIMEYIRLRFRTDIRLENLAEIAGLTPNSCSRYFKKMTGKTPMQFINELRVSFACQHLIQPNPSLKNICYESGFNNLVSFHKTFKQFKGVTPREFQRVWLQQRNRKRQ